MASSRTRKPPAPQPLPSPEAVGSISAVELTELRTRSQLISYLRGEIFRTESLLSVATNEKQQYTRALIGTHVADPGDSKFSIDEESGTIVRHPETS